MGPEEAIPNICQASRLPPMNPKVDKRKIEQQQIESQESQAIIWVCWY